MQLSNLLRTGTIALRRMNVPLYLSKFSKKDFTVHQHLLILAVKELEEKSYRNLHDLVEDYTSIAEVLGLKRIPHFTTPQKFLSRIPAYWLHMIMKRMVQLLTSGLRLSIDATGFKQVSGSHHYLMRIGKKICRRDFLKGIHLLEIDAGLFYDARSINGRRHESPFFLPLLKGVSGDIEAVYADKGFDSIRNQEYLFENGIESYLDVKSELIKGKYRKRVYRRKMEDPLWKEEYRRGRNCIESSYFVLKNRFGEHVLGRKWWMRKRYHLMKLISHNFYALEDKHKEKVLLSLLVWLILMEDFYKPLSSTSASS